MMIALLNRNALRVQALLGCAALLVFPVPAAHSQSAPQQSQLTLQVQVPLVVEDVVVLDSHNQPVHNLTAADFTVTDNGKPVPPQSFEEHAAPAPAQSAAEPAAASQSSGPGVNGFTNRNAVPTGAPLNILLLDALNTPMDAQVRVRMQMLKFLTTLPPGVPIAIYGLSSRLHLLQGFTSDPALLKAAINAKGSGAQISPWLDNPVSGGPGAEAEGLGELGELLSVKEQYQVLFAMQQFVQENVATEQNTQRAERTLEAMGQLARFLSVLPGRKNLIWFSGAFPLDITPNGAQTAAAALAATQTDSSAQDSSAMFSNSPQTHFGDIVRVTDDLLRRSQVAIYPVDARGIFTDSSMDASRPISQNGTTFTQQELRARGQGIGGSGYVTEGADAANNFGSETAEEHETMNRMASETGGKAYYNTGDLKAAVTSAIAFGSNYYTLSYTPPSGKWDSKFHRIEIRVNRPGLHLTYRRGYYADNPNEDLHGHPQPQASAMQAAMLHGAPDPSGLIFDVSATVADNTSGQLVPGSRPDPKLMQPPYRTCTLDAHLDIHNLKMTLNDAGAYEGTLEFAMVVYNADGEVVNQGSRIGHIVLPPDRYMALLTHGLNIRQSIDVPVKGNYFLRVGVHDPASNNVGAVEIPVAVLQPASGEPHSAQAPATAGVL
jgi:VWFA-related protein